MKILHASTLALILGFTALHAEEPLRTYHDILSVIPKELNPDYARKWSQAEKDVANMIIKERLVDTKRKVSFEIRAEPIEAWPGLTVWCPLPSEEGYPIRMFLGLFKNEEQYGKVAALRPGDRVLVEGVLDAALFQDLWGSGSLTICLREGVITRLGPDRKPVPPLPKPDLSIVSATYGGGGKVADVTERVTAILNEPGAQFYANTPWLSANPAADGTRSLVVVYQTGGKRRIFSCGEGGVVNAELLLAKTE